MPASDNGTESDGSIPSAPRRNNSTNSNFKRRASRAGTRSVSTLTASQLERKRANDREAQRAIRQRTRDYIDHLEKQVTDLGNKGDELTSALRRNRALESEVAQLRCQLQLSEFCLSCSARNLQTPNSTGAKSSPTPQNFLHQLANGRDTSRNFVTRASYGQAYSPAPPSSTTGSVSSTDYPPDVESERSIDAAAKFMAEAGFLLGPYTLSGRNSDPWDQCPGESHDLSEDISDALMDDDFESSTTAGFMIPIDP